MIEELSTATKPRRNSENTKCKSVQKESEYSKKGSIARKSSLEPSSSKRDNKFLSY